MKKTNIVVVSSNRGEEGFNCWQQPERAFSSLTIAEKYIEDMFNMHKKVSDEQYEEAQNVITAKKWELQCQYYDTNTCELIEGKTEEEWNDAYHEFETKTQYEIIEKEFGISKEEYMTKDNDVKYGFLGYSVNEVELISE